MWHNKSILSSFCLLLLFILSSIAFSQSGQIVPIKGVSLADSGKAQATAVQGSLRPVGIDPAPIHRDENSSENQQAQSPLLSTTAAAPWAIFDLSGTQWEWNVRRPGDYAAQSVVGSITANVDILINFSGFEDLNSSNPHTGIVETYYAASLGNQRVEDVDWASASDFNGRTLLITQDPDSPIPVAWGLWNRVCIKTLNSATEYSDEAVITFQMQNTNPWVDPDLPIKQ
jgi:hypothetical protein